MFLTLILDTGLIVTSYDDLLAWTRGADASGLQVSVHAIGDKAINWILSIFENVTQARDVMMLTHFQDEWSKR